ncbi:MAG: T9SS type A sorting domain-containing protein, partial [Calditrichota bacterium]
PADRAVIIAGADYTRMVVNHSPDLPPVICGFNGNSGGISFANDLTVKNAIVMPAASDGTLGWAFFSAANPNLNLTLDNVLMEHTRWSFVQSNDAPGTNIKISDSYFVNMNGNTGRRSGGVYDNVDYNTDTVWVENSTHIWGQGMLYRFREFPINRVIFNHNTFINIGHSIFETAGYQSNMYVTQNIFINCQTKPYRPGLDYPETDLDSLPTGIINARVLPDSLEQVERKILVDRNLIYWDPRLENIPDTANSIQLGGYTNWVSQMITMNSRTQAMFDDDVTYPYLTEGAWYEKLPDFEQTENLLGEMVETLKNYSIAIMHTGAGEVLTDWRLVSTEPVVPDWPIPVDLSYSDADLLTGGISGFPLGDLNWFPAKKAEWLAQRDQEYEYILGPTGIKKIGGSLPADFELQQNYPNPFNPTTVINFTIPKYGHVTLNVYNSLGQEVATLMDGFSPAQTYNITFDGSGFASGVYFYALKYDNNSISKKMILMK